MSATSPETGVSAARPAEKPMLGCVFIVAAPSGAGKTSLVRALLAQRPGVELSVSFTTRAPRPGEENGVDYFFVGVQQFEAMRAAGDLLEWAQVHGNYYGTSRQWIESRIRAGSDILLEIDYQGAAQVRRMFPDAVGVFIAPPSLAELRERLVKRGQDSAEVIAGRLRAAEHELKQASQFEYVIINQDFASALAQLLAVVDAARLRFAKQRIRNGELFNSWGVE